MPNPSLFYLLFVYYEVYNLKKNDFGSTKYRVSYELQSLQEGNISVRMLNALGRLVGVDRKAEVVTVEYAHEGGKADDYGYLELDMSNTPGRRYRRRPRRTKIIERCIDGMNNALREVRRQTLREGIPNQASVVFRYARRE